VGVRLGGHRVSIAAGRQATIRLRLTAFGFKLLQRAGRVQARVEATYKQPAGDTTTTTRTVLLTVAKPKGN